MEDTDVIPRGIRISRALSAFAQQHGFSHGQVVVVTHASVMLALVAAAASGVGESERGDYKSEVTAGDLAAVHSVLREMDGARPAGCFTIQRQATPLRDLDLDEESQEDEVPDAFSMWQPWTCDLSCNAQYLSREACEDGTGTPIYRLPSK